MTSDSAAFNLRALAVFAVGLIGVAAVECAMRLASPSSPVDGTMVQWAVVRGILVAAPLAMLPALWYARTGGRHLSAWAGVGPAAAGVVLTLIIAGWVAPIGIRAYNLQSLERARAIVEENFRARRGAEGNGNTPRPQRPGRVPPMQPLTPREAVALDPTAKTLPDLIRSRTDKDRGPIYRSEARRRLEYGALAGVLAYLGWTLGSLGRTHALHAVMWWMATWLVTFHLGGARTGLSLGVFGVAALSLALQGNDGTADAPSQKNRPALTQQP